LIDAHIGGSIYSGTNSTGTYTGILASTLPGRGTANGGLSYYNSGSTAVPTNAAAGPNGETVNHDGIIFNGVNADGSKNTTILSAQSYYKSLTNADEPFVYSASYIN